MVKQKITNDNEKLLVLSSFVLVSWIIFRSIFKPYYSATWSDPSILVVTVIPIAALAGLVAYFYTKTQRKSNLSKIVALGLGISIAGYILQIVLTLSIHGLYN